MKYQHRLLGMLSLLPVITYLDRVCIAVAGPRMQDALHISPRMWDVTQGAGGGATSDLPFVSFGAFDYGVMLSEARSHRRTATRFTAAESGGCRE